MQNNRQFRLLQASVEAHRAIAERTAALQRTCQHKWVYNGWSGHRRRQICRACGKGRIVEWKGYLQNS